MNEKINLAGMRKVYASAPFDETHVNQYPIDQFEIWFNEAVYAKIEEPNAMTLATLSNEGFPNARIVLLKEFDKKGFVFYTNYRSHKGKELELNPTAVLLFFWKELVRQVRIKGKVEKVSGDESEEYFHSRPRESQLGAWASKQSSEIPDRKFLEDKFQSLQKEYDGKEIPLPSFWGGYRVIPFEIEFWQGRENRLHDRILYRLVENDWNISRLSP
ncbi:MAG: pyridoxamine 5'-phosphate oxidase [Ignavibacteria bacterium]|nr:pyridoxamine 5'-phosphate oxidase [Ignavibacteria bacterium]